MLCRRPMSRWMAKNPRKQQVGLENSPSARLSNERPRMNENLAPDELERTIKLITDLERLRGSSCKSCNVNVCHHEALFSISMGFKNMPLCCSCLAAEYDRNPTQMRDELWSSLMRRPCHRAGWAWANREEAFEPGD